MLTMCEYNRYVLDQYSFRYECCAYRYTRRRFAIIVYKCIDSIYFFFSLLFSQFIRKMSI